MVKLTDRRGYKWHRTTGFRKYIEKKEIKLTRCWENTEDGHGFDYVNVVFYY